MGSSDAHAGLKASTGLTILRRNHGAKRDNKEKGAPLGTAVASTRCGKLRLTTKMLRERDDLCAIDGVLYDLDSFAPTHPGGSVVLASGGSDCTALFHSMHPGRKPLKSKLLQLHRVGQHNPQKGEFPEVPTYEYNSHFALDLRARVRKVMGTTSWFAPQQFWIRTIVILMLTVWAEVSWIVSGRLVYGIAAGALHALIGLSVQHDASHGAISSQGWVNGFFAHGADIIGNSRWIWFQQHIMWHHPYTNDIILDGDAVSAQPALLFHDYTKDSRAEAPNPGWWHQFQHLYMHVILAFYGPSITLNFGYMRNLRHNDKVPDKLFEQNGFFEKSRPLAWFLRFFYFVRVALLPWYISAVPLVIGTFLVSTVCGAVLTLLFVVSHNFEGSERAPSKDHVKSKGEGSEPVKADWYKAQVETACTYGGWTAMVLTGGLNLQIEHHCFPRMSSWHYPKIQKVVRQCCKDHDVKYAYYPTLWSNLRSTWRYMKHVGIGQVLREARED